MNRILVAAVASLGMLTASTSVMALGDCGPGQTLFCTPAKPPGGNPGKNPPPTVAAPEFDVGSAALGAGILIAGLLLVAEGLRRRR